MHMFYQLARVMPPRKGLLWKDLFTFILATGRAKPLPH